MNSTSDGAPSAPGYDILERIGGSDGADVFLAEQRALGRHVALKVLRGSGDAEQLARFEFETRTAAELLHPNIVPLLDSGASADGRRWYAMPYLRGGDLARRLPVPADEVRRIALALCDALWYAHGRNVVHRDIKPSNVLFDEDGRPMLADFGIATTIIGRLGLTLPGRIVGDARYTSPEQARGEKVDPRADLYSLAVVTWEMLTGRAPYAAADPVTLAAAHAQAPIPTLPPEHAAWQSFFERALAKAPGERFLSARTMAQAIERIALEAGASPAVAGAAPAVPIALDVAQSAPADDALPRMHADARVREASAARGAPRRPIGPWSIAAIAVVAIVVFAVQRGRDERFEPLAVEPAPATAAAPAAPATTAPDVPAAEPGSVAAAAHAPAQGIETDVEPPANAGRERPGSDGAREDGDPDEAPDADDEAARDAAWRAEALAGDEADDDEPRASSRPDTADEAIPGAAPVDEPLDGEDGDFAASGTEDPGEPFGRPGDGDDFAAADEAEPGDFSLDGFGDERDAPRLEDDWAPPIAPLVLRGTPEDQLDALDAHVEDARAWLEDERWRLQELRDTASPRELRRELDAFEAETAAYERWLDRIESLRGEIERERWR